MIDYDDLPIVSNKSNLRSIIISITSEIENKKRVGFTLVNNKNNSSFLGLITDGDLRRALSFDMPGDWDNIIAENICSKNPKTIDKNATVIEALDKMGKNKQGSISCLGVTSEGVIIGFITMQDILRINN